MSNEVELYSGRKIYFINISLGFINQFNDEDEQLHRCVSGGHHLRKKK